MSEEKTAIITSYRDFLEWDFNLETGEETLKIDGVETECLDLSE